MIKKLVSLFAFLLFGLVSFYSLSCSVDEERSGMIIMPLLFSYTNHDYQIVQWLPDHPQYEMAEIMVHETEGEEPFLWLLLTDRVPHEGSKHQIDYTNDPDWASSLQEVTGDRETHLAEIDYQRSVDEGGKLHFIISLQTVDEKLLLWDFLTTGPPTTENAPGLIDQSGHSLKSGILVMYIEKTVLADSTTSLTIGEEEYPVQVWEEISYPPFFTAYRGACTEDLADSFIRADEESFELRGWPKELAVGEEWVYLLGGGRQEVWSIEEKQDNILTIGGSKDFFGQRKRLTAEIIDGGLEIQSISLEHKEGNLTIEFSPNLPDFEKMQTETLVTSQFRIHIDGHLDEMTGSMTVERQGDRVSILLSPETPEWAVQNKMQIHIDMSESGYTIESKTIHTPSL
jgi:hypothetical protein